MKLSIITVNLNNAAGLEKTIQSVVCQEFTDYEYIIIDGNSTDSSVEIIQQYADAIHYWVSEPDQGIYQAMNKGIAQASGEYIIFMNSGDCLINPQTLKKVFSKEHTADLLTGSIIFDEKIPRRESIPDKITFYYFKTSTIWHQSTFTKRELFYEIGFYDEQLKISSDWKFALLALVLYNKSIERLDEDIALVDATGISGSKETHSTLRKEQDETIQRYFPYFYDDYKELYRLKKFSVAWLKRYAGWKFRQIFYR
ncbi:glycosyl transferase [Bacteroidia bacterium]|nr:glycosyl transferase [Bacteroidia bacterium]